MLWRYYRDGREQGRCCRYAYGRKGNQSRVSAKGTRLADRDISGLTPQYCLKVLCLARLLVPKSDIRCAAGREVYFKGIEPTLFKVVDSIFASGYLTADGQGIDDTIKMIENAGFTGEIESKDC